MPENSVLSSGERLTEQDIRFSEVSTAGLPPLPDGIEFIDKPLKFEAAVGIEPIELSIPIGDLDPDNVRFAHLDEFGRWEFLVPYVDGDRLVMATNDFSVVGWVTDRAGDAAGVVWGGVTDGAEWVVGGVADGADWAADAFTGRTDPPPNCDLQGGDGADWADHTGSPGNEFAHVCMRSREDGRVELAIRSNRSGPIEVILPDSMTPDWVWVEGMSDWATPIFAALGTSANSYVLGPGRDMTIGYSQPIGQIPPQEVWIIQTGVAQAWGEMAGLVDGWVPDLMAANAMLCFLGDEQSYSETFANCVQDGLPKAVEELTTDALDSRVDAAYLKMAEAIDADNLRWSRESIDSFQAKFGKYRKQVQSSEKWLARAKSFFKGLKASLIIVDVYTNIALSLWGDDEASLTSVFLTGRCGNSGPLASVTVTGVAESVNVRRGPGTSEEQVGQIPAHADVDVFLASVREADGRWWVAVVLPDESACGWVAADFLKKGDGTLLEKPFSELMASEFIRRAVMGLEPELLHAAFHTETEDRADSTSFDPAWTADGLRLLADLPVDTKPVGYVPTEYASAPESQRIGNNCVFPSHGVICFFQLVAPNGALLALAETGQYGDGITNLVVSPAQN